MNNIFNKIRNFKIYHIASIVLLFASLIIGQLYSLSKANISANILFKISCCFLVLGDIMLMFYKKEYHTYLYLIVFGIFSLFVNLSIIKYRGTESLTANAYILDFAVSFTFVLMLAKLFCRKENYLKKIAQWIVRNKLIILIGLIYTALYIPCYNAWFKIDSYTYYNSIVENAGTWDFNICHADGLLMGGHTSYAYSILLQIGELLIPYAGYGQRTVNLILSLVTIGLFYKICEYFWLEKSKNYPFLLTMIFAISPAVLGISYLMSTDFALLCYITVFVYAYISQNRVLKWLAGIAVCFSKEIGIIVLAGFYLGECIYSAWDGSESKIKKFFKECFSPRRIIDYSGAIVFICFVLFGAGGWLKNLRSFLNPETNVQPIVEKTYIWWHYPMFKIFEYFFMNFNWLIFPILVIAFVSRHVKSQKQNVEVKSSTQNSKKIFIPLFWGYLFFCASGLIYLTYVHYRYIQAGHLFFTLMLGWILIDYSRLNKWACKATLIIVSLAFFVSSYIMIDPVTYAFFNHLDMGNGQTVSTRQYWYIEQNPDTGDGYYWEADDSVMNAHYLAEGTEFNLENIGMQKMLEKAICDIDYNSDDLIVVDNFGGWSQYTLGQLFGVMKSDGYYWDTDRKTVTRSVTSCPLNIVVDTSEYDTSEYESIYYFNFPFNKYYKSSLLEESTVLSEQSISYGRWKMKVYKVK